MNFIATADLHDFDEHQIGHRVLSDDPVVRVLMVSLRAGQELHDRVAEGMITMYVISGEVEKADGAGQMPSATWLRLGPGEAYDLRAKADTRLLVTVIRPAGQALWHALAPNGQDLDLRPVPRPQRHSTVFYAFDRLALEEAFFIVNDHDPQPLRMQLEQARPGQIEWEYVERGAGMFRIRVQRIAQPSA